MRRKISLMLLVLFGLLGLSIDLFAQHQHSPEIKTGPQSQVTKPKKLYRCPMHPQVVSDKPGKCPICAMDLVEVTEEIKEVASSDGLPEEDSIVKISQMQQELIGLERESLSSRPLFREIRTVAKIAFDPELYKTEEEFIQALKMKNELKESPLEIRQRAEALVLAAELKLKLQGLGDEQIKELKNKREGDRALLISDAKTPYVWAYAIIYEYDMGLIKIGQHLTLKAIAYPDSVFRGIIKAIDPVLDASTRSARIRVLVDDPKGKLKPNMYADAFIHIELGRQLSLSQEAILDTGSRKIVYLELNQGEFKAQEVEVGLEAQAEVEGQQRRFFPVIKGLKENDIVVTKGNFLIDSQSQLKGGMSALWGQAMEIKEEEETRHRH